MKQTMLLSFLAIVLAFVLPVLLSAAPGVREAPPEPTPAPPNESAPDEERTPVQDSGITLAVQTEDGVTEMTMADYLPAALAGEMPAAFHEEALKAQAVALRSYALHYRAERKDAHPEADVCTISGCCAAFASEEELRLRWGSNYAFYAEKIADAVRETDGQYLVWESEPILAVFHASSEGQTESGESLGLTAPYLQSVSTPETADTVLQLVTAVEVTAQEFKTAISGVASEAVFGDDPGTWLGAVTQSDTGRVERIQIGGAEVSGLALRQLFSLRSTDFVLRWDGKCFRFDVSGYGHGVGMSQYGADLMADSGADYTEILAHYYPGAELVIAMARQQPADAGGGGD